MFRGYARLCDLAIASRADVYDAKSNPTGTQRDLSPKHARNAYEYVKTRELAFWPEVFLCARDPKVFSFDLAESSKNIGILKIDLAVACRKDPIAISRVDGNHRLHYAGGIEEEYPPIKKIVSFCLAFNLTSEQEITLFKDINDNQKAMSTSHLDQIQVRLTPAEELKRKSPGLFIAEKLGRDGKSPLHDRVYFGGKKGAAWAVPLRSIRTGIDYMLSRSTQLAPLGDPDAQYKVVRNYFQAVKKWQPKAWSSPRDYIVLRGAGLWAICFIGASVVDRALLDGKFGVEDMLRILTSGKTWDWTNPGDFKGYSGRGGASEIAKQVTRAFHDPNRLSSEDLLQKIMAGD